MEESPLAEKLWEVDGKEDVRGSFDGNRVRFRSQFRELLVLSLFEAGGGGRSAKGGEELVAAKGQ